MLEKTVLRNGLTIITDHNEKAVSTLLCYWVKAGGHHEGGYPYGIAHFLEHMMFKGTASRTKENINEQAEESGGRLNASTGADRTRYFMYTPYDEWKRGAELLTDMVFRPAFPEEEIVREKTVVIEEIKRSEDNPREYGVRQLFRILRGMHPERASVLGTEASVASITRDDLLRFHRQFYQPGNVVLVATGHIDHDALVAYVDSLTVPATTSLPSPVGLAKLSPCPLDGRTIHIARDIRQAQLHWGMYGPDAGSADKYAGFVALHLLGGGRSSRLRKLIRAERGLAYDVSARLSPLVSEGFISGYAGIDPQHIDEVRRIIVTELERLGCERVQDDELLRAQKAITGGYLIAEDRPEAVNARLAAQHMYGDVIDPGVFADRIREVTADDVLRFAQTYLQETKMLFIQVSREGEAGAGRSETDERTA
ncbi:M16 family metallopeptidase [Paenibacillus hamazuiensis]|uniref:M16 family metallopeptidase n=1 Tax=Paenibacillus hamazuiensis TaxID=2936508 RepID=UPI00200E12A9|nr:pitrilysin family protein [Paenibacillus hamazuiensis]